MSQRKAPSSPGKAASTATTTEVRSDDSDLEDLLGHSNGTAPPPAPSTNKVKQSAASRSDTDNEERVPLVGSSSPIASSTKSKDMKDENSKGHPSSVEAAALERKRFLQQQRASATGFSHHPQQGSCLQYCTAYVSLVCYYHPWVCSSIAVAMGLALMLALVNAVFNPVATYGVMQHDHSNIRSKYDLSMNKIDHWCLGGGNENCLCEDPLTPTSQMHRRAWVKAFWANKERVAKYQDRFLAADLDVAFVGESLVEEMSGRWLGREDIAPLAPVRQAYYSRFSKVHGGRLEGVALGIAGDTAPNVLYRLMHGEMPDYLQPRVWWLVLGMNDVSRMQCSEEVAILGILRVVEEILERRPNARVVINSLLPMAYSRGGQNALLHDYQDSLGEMGNKKRDRVKNDPASDNAPANDEKDGWRRSLRTKKAPKGPKKDADKTDDTAAETLLETQQRQKEGKRKRGKDNPVLDAEAHKVHKYNFLTGLLTHRAKAPPLWTAVYAINKELQAFADEHDNVDFFDATPVFASKLPKGKYELHSAKITARGHPTPAGFRDWEDAIVVRLNSILSGMKETNPDLFPVLERTTDDYAGLPNRTDHPGFGFDEDEPPDVEMRLDGDDFYTEDEGSGKGEDNNADQPDANGEGGDGAEGNDVGLAQPASDEDAQQVDHPPHDPPPAEDGAQESPNPDGDGDSPKKEPADADPGGEAHSDPAPASTGDEAQPEAVVDSAGEEAPPENAPVEGATPESDQPPATTSEETTGGSDGPNASGAEGGGEPSTEGNGGEPEGGGENAGDNSEAAAPESEAKPADTQQAEGDVPSPPQEETPQE